MTVGPFQTEQAAIEAAQLNAAAWLGPDASLAGLLDSVNAAGVELGDYDRQTLAWIARTWAPQAVQVVASLIARAAAPVAAEHHSR